MTTRLPNYRRATFPGGYSPAETAGSCTFDAKAAAQAVEFFPRFLSFLGHFDRSKIGTPFQLEKWQANIVAALFGWKRPDGTRRYRTAFIEIPRKAGKTALVAGLGLYSLLCENEGDNQVFCCAASSNQAALVFQDAKQHVLRRESFARKLTPKFNSLEYKTTDGRMLGFWKVLSSDGGLQHGLRPHIVIADELHEWKGRDLWDAMQTGRGNRSQPLTVAITTAGWDRTSICYEQYSYASQVRDGIKHDESFLPVIYEAAPDDPWDKPATWKKAQPNLGVSVPLSYYAEECTKAKNLPSYENAFRRLYLNQWTESERRWLSMKDWDECGKLEYDLEQLKGLPCYIGIDYGWVDDYSAVVAVIPKDGHYYVIAQCFMPEKGRRDRRQEPTWQFIQRGLVTVTQGNVTDIEEIYRYVTALAETYELREIAIDPANAMAQIQQFMDTYGEESVFKFGQHSKNYNEPCLLLEKLLQERKLHHGKNAIMRWMASNAVTQGEPGLGTIMPKKAKSQEKIDGICALTMALGRAMLHQETQPSFYADHELEIG